MSTSIDFRVDETALSALRGMQIDGNFTECRDWLTENLAPYKSMAVTDETASVAKTYRANIRKVRERIEESRKLAKSAALAVYQPFEQKCKELTGLCDEAAGSLDEQLKGMEEAKKAVKDAMLREFFSTNAGDAYDFLTYEQAFNPRWLNVTFSEEAARNEIMAKIVQCVSGVNAIRSLHSEFETTLLDEYRQNHDVTACITKNEQLMKLKEIERRRAAEQAARRMAESSRRQPQTASQTARDLVDEDGKELPQTASDVRQETQENKARETVYTLRLEVRGEKDKLMSLSRFMRDNHIDFTKI